MYRYIDTDIEIQIDLNIYIPACICTQSRRACAARTATVRRPSEPSALTDPTGSTGAVPLEYPAVLRYR